MQWLNMTGRYHSLIAAVIECAVNDLRGTDPRCGRFERDRAMAFILSDDYEAYCLELCVDVEALRERAAAFYQKIIEKEKPRTARYAHSTGRLPGNRAFSASKMEILKPYSPHQGSPPLCRYFLPDA